MDETDPLKGCLTRDTMERKMTSTARQILDRLTDSGRFERVLRILLVLNVFDAVLTLIWVETGIAYEANPLMAGPLEGSPLGFMVIKMTLVALSIGLIWRLRERRAARTAMIPVALLYAFVAGGHVGYALVLATTESYLLVDGIRSLGALLG